MRTNEQLCDTELAPVASLLKREGMQTFFPICYMTRDLDWTWLWPDLPLSRGSHARIEKTLFKVPNKRSLDDVANTYVQLEKKKGMCEVRQSSKSLSGQQSEAEADAETCGVTD